MSTRHPALGLQQHQQQEHQQHHQQQQEQKERWQQRAGRDGTPLFQGARRDRWQAILPLWQLSSHQMREMGPSSRQW